MVSPSAILIILTCSAAVTIGRVRMKAARRRAVRFVKMGVVLWELFMGFDSEKKRSRPTFCEEMRYRS